MDFVKIIKFRYKNSLSLPPTLSQAARHTFLSQGRQRLSLSLFPHPSFFLSFLRSLFVCLFLSCSLSLHRGDNVWACKKSRSSVYWKCCVDHENSISRFIFGLVLTNGTNGIEFKWLKIISLCHFQKTCGAILFLSNILQRVPDLLRICSRRNTDLITHAPLYVLCVYLSRWVLVRKNRSSALHGCNARSYNALSYIDVTHIRTRRRSLMYMYFYHTYIYIYIHMYV